MRRSIATVCLSGSLVDKMHAASAAGFDGIEMFEPDLVSSELSPEEVVALAARLGLTLDLYQPFRDFEGVGEEALVENLRRAEAKFRLMNRLGIDTMLVCSNVATATIDSDQVSADQLRRMGEVAAEHGVRIAFEALAWGRFVDDYRRSWRIVELADHPNVGVCLDSFHILSRGHDPADIERIPGDKIFFLQLADAPALSMDVLSWSRHHRVFPGEGSFDLPAFLAHVLRAGYDGPLSLEVFNDTFRQTDVDRTAVHALRSLVWLEDQSQRILDGSEGLLPCVEPPTGFDFVEVKAEDTSDVEVMLGQLGFAFRGRHRSKPVSLWTSGDARIVLNEQHARDTVAHLSAIGFLVAEPDAAGRRAQELMAPVVHRRTYATEVPLQAVEAPDGTEIFFGGPPTSAWIDEFHGGTGTPGELVTAVDHVNLAQPWQDFDEAVLFFTSVLGLEAEDAGVELAGPRGLVRSRVMSSPLSDVRLPLNVVPPADEQSPSSQHVALLCSDTRAAVRRARAAGLSILPVPANYYDDLQARLGLDDEFRRELEALGVMYERDATGEYFNAYTRTIGQVFFELVERRDGYSGYGASNAPVRMAAQRR
ncbi:bifunctional sugar phosphate isomerase/epimerase/4-hydroxyphenylpyruvate dioxygenase family protein [Aeromicrobium endophyticum]|uniref:3-dehydroshikimate dehydratase n=1 Tax=Aeromicrobium endophyticum TaxID=2292704 RepID=A0A371P4R7_9ACTN|nr:sugar phosphate isomerase/epimerase and 4-hydroxyphenylpyruvate domain-containing protein [Aeromicrobium endophyticum]REK70919.1 sugar phosphate isomerase/epimerase and 4-hydroxyphenylpyruvate domain-containing protein [Aeromicrobium endophyticum]